VYSTTLNDPGILIAPTILPKATLYVITSESNQSNVTFTDARSGKTLSGRVEPGGAAIILVGVDGNVTGSWNWAGQ
jgi:hypothetical protein